MASDLSDHYSLDLIITNEYEPFNSAAFVNFEHPTDVLDIANTQLKTRFQGMHDIVSSFSVLFPATLLAKDDNIVKAAKSLQEKYPDDFSTEFPLQLLSFRMSMNSEKIYNS